METTDLETYKAQPFDYTLLEHRILNAEVVRLRPKHTQAKL